MNFNKLERKYGKYAIPNLSLVIIATYILGYVLQLISPYALAFLYLDPYLVLHGQVWRIVSWILIPPFSASIWTVINIFFFFSIGRTLENLWGDFRYNVYIFTGVISVIIGVFVIYAFGSLTGIIYVGSIGQYVSTYYINISVIMAFALTIPDMEVRLWFVIPLKMKWLAYVEAAMLLLDFVLLGSWAGRLVMLLSMSNFLIFYFSSKKTGGASLARRKNKLRMPTSHKNDSAPGAGPKHKCAICGRTEKDDSTLSFRFCSKCAGNYEYCQDHLFVHEHICS